MSNYQLAPYGKSESLAPGSQSPITNYQLLITLLVGIGLLALLFVAAPLAVAQEQNPVSPTEAMAVGNQNYEAGNYDEAADIYESIIAVGIQNSDLYYNLGNSYFKQGDLGRAILNYRRAHRLNPRDSDIKTNLMIARAQTLDQLEVSGEGSFSNLIQRAEDWLTLNEASILALVLWVIVSAFIIMAILLPQFRQVCLWAAAVVGIFLVIGLISIFNRHYIEWRYPAAVIIAPEVDVTSGPGSTDQYLVEFNLHTGAEVNILESRPGWRRVALPGNDFQGWVPEEAIQQVAIN
jgi:tetratricopeptide (TPR) repeat protein